MILTNILATFGEGIDMKQLSLVLLAIMCSAADAKEEAADRERMQGSWTMVSGVSAGQKIEDALRFEIKGAKMALHTNGNLVASIPMRLHVEGESRMIDLTVSPDGKTTLVFEGIYALKDDEFKLCVNLKEKDRPTEFVSKPDSVTVLLVCKRDKP